jgi:hypothetical protein
MTLKNVVKANIYLSDLSKDFNAVNEVCLMLPFLAMFYRQNPSENAVQDYPLENTARSLLTSRYTRN